MQGDKDLSKMQTDPEFAMHLLKARGYNPDNWTPEQLDVLSLCLDELHKSGDSQILRQLNNIDFWRTPPTIEEFLESPEFLGSICQPDPEKNITGIFPKWRELLYRDFAEGSDIDQLIFTGSIGLGKCLKVNELCNTVDGLKPIQDVKVGDLVYTEKGINRVQDWFDEGEIDTTTLTTKHKHTLTGGYWRHRVRVLNRSTLEIEWKLMRDLEQGDTVIFKPQTVPSGQTVPHSELTGWAAGDGCRNKLGKVNLCVNEEKEKEYVAALVDAAKPTHSRRFTEGGSFNIHAKGGDIPLEATTLCEHYSYEKFIPQTILRDKASLRKFLRGYFSANGTAAEVLEVTTTSSHMAEQVRISLINLGIYCGVTSKIPILDGEPQRRAYTVRVIGTASKQKFHDEIGLIPYKQRQLQKQLEKSTDDDHWFSFKLTTEGLRTLRELQPTFNAKHPHPQGLTKTETPRGLCHRLKTQNLTISHLNKILDAGGKLSPALQQLASGELMFDTVETIEHGRDHCYDISVENDPTYISNGIISHNTFCGCVALLYKIAYALCLREPLGYYGLSKATQLVYSFFSVTQKQIKGGAFHDALSMMRNSPFFTERIKDNLNNRKFADRRVELHGNVIIEAGSQTHEALGRNVLCSLIDEINFRLEAEAAEAAKELIDNIARRRTSRFGNTHKGLLIIISSAKNEADFLTGHINKNRNKSNVAIYDYPWWEVVGPIKMKGGYSGENFYVDIGDQTSPPKILNPEDVEETPEHRLLPVPVEHKQAFEDDLDGAIRDIAGKTTGRQSKFFGNIVPLLNSIKSDIPNSMSKETIQLSYGSDNSILDYVNQTVLTQVRGGTVVPRRHSDAPRFIHMDMSSGAQDAMGFAMVHPTGLKKIDTVDRITGRKHELQKPVFEVDLAFRITRSDPNEPIDFGEVRAFIWWLYRQAKFKIKKVTADLLHMSRETLAILKQEGLETGYLSVDKKLSLLGAAGKGPQGAYHILRQTINERRFTTFPVEWAMLEMLNLELLDDKVDHPSEWHTKWPSIHSPTGFFEPGTSHASKDVADALCGAIFEATQYENAYSNMKPENMVQVFAEVGSEPVLNEGKPMDVMVM